MKALRLVLTQNKAHYRKEETVDNKLTYPLPPFSTVIGAIHNACSFTEYHPMDVSIQGTYKSLVKQPYTDYCFLDSVMDDRGILVKMKSPTLLSLGFERVAEAKKPTGNSFRKGITIEVKNQELLDEYRNLRNLSDEISNFKKERIDRIKNIFKKRKKSLSDKKKKLDKKSDEFIKITQRETEVKNLEKKILERTKEFEIKNYLDKISLYQSLTTSLKFYEVLLDVHLIIHIKSEEENLLKTIKDNIYNLKSIGRSEDFVNVEECEIVELRNLQEEEEVSNRNPAYVNLDFVRNKEVVLPSSKKGIPADGTKYYLGKEYTKENGYREFKDKKKVLYISKYSADEDSGNIFIDEEKEDCLVNFS